MTTLYCSCVGIYVLVSVPDPKPTPAQIGFSIVHILEAIYVPDKIIYVHTFHIPMP